VGAAAVAATAVASVLSPRWVALLVVAGAVHALVPLRHYVLFRSPTRWTDEGALYSWHMKLTERTGWLVLQVAAQGGGAERERGERGGGGSGGGGGGGGSGGGPGGGSGSGGSGGGGGDVGDATAHTASCDGGASGPSARSHWWLVPETDTALHPDQAGALVHNPAMLLQYVSHVQHLFSRAGVHNISVRPLSCVSVNGRPAQPLLMDVDLLPHVAAYFAASNELRAHSGVGRFLHTWRPHAPLPLCDLGASHGTPDEQEASRRQLESDLTYRWLYRPFFARPRLADWPWRGRSRTGNGDERGVIEGQAEGSEAQGAKQECPAPPAWAVRCSFLHATEAVWCPLDS